MKKLTALILSAALICTLFIPPAHASNRYNPDDWRYIEDQVAVPSFSPPDKYYGGNCIYFVRHVCLSEDRGELPKYNGGAHRELVGLTVIEGGQWLNDVHGDERVNRGPTSAEVKAVFANAQSGDVVQMHWGGSGWHTQHTALINDIDENGVTFFQSHVETDSKNICGFKCSSNYYDWKTLSSRYSYSKTNGGLSIYSFNNVIIKPALSVKNKYTYRCKTGKDLNYTFTLKSGTKPVNWSHSGTLPSGVTFKDGVLSGKPAQKGKFSITVKASNSKGSDSKIFILDIWDSDDLPYITTAKTLKAGTLNTKYPGVTLTAAGRTPITWTSNTLPSGLTLNSSTGAISGKPSQSGVFSVKVTAKNELGKHEKTFSITICEKPVILTDANLPTGYTYTQYNSVTLQASGIPAPSWSVAALSSLPAGMSLSSKGVLSGKPTKTGTFKFSVKATNSAGSSTKKFTLVVKTGSPVISTTSLPNAQVGTAYSKQLEGNNLPSGSAWAATSTLPQGLTLSKNGLLSGTPKTSGTYTIYARAINKTGTYVDKSFKLKITGGITSISTTKLSNATVGKKYSATLKAKSSVSVSWCSTSTLPMGLTLSSGGVLSGTPQKSGTYNIYIRAVDPYGAYTDKTLKLTINKAEALEIKTSSLKNATVGKKYSVTLKATGAAAWCATSTLPWGLTLSSKGVLSGTPQKSGTYNIYIRAVDAYGAYTDKTLKLKIVDDLSIVNESLSDATVGKSYKAELQAKSSTAVAWCATSQLPPGLTLSSKGVLSGVPACKGSYNVYLRAVNSYGTYVSKTLTLKIGGSDKNSAHLLSNATINEYYVDDFSVSFPKSSGDIKWSLSPKLPKGLSLTSYGESARIKGTPKTAGSYRIKATLKDEAGKSVYKWISLTVMGNLTIKTSSLPAATVGKSYKTTLKASGADSFVWGTYWGWDLPEGLTCSPSGVISGTPLYSGEWSICVYVYSPNGLYTEKYFTLKVSGDPEITTESLPVATSGTPYTTTLEASGVKSFVWGTYWGWDLPEGLTCSPSGVISGTPLYSGEWSICVYAYSPNGLYTEKYFTLKVTGEATKITTKSLPNATAGKSYKATLKATGADSFVWGVYGTWPPEGLTCSPSGVISGTPSYSGEWSFYVYAYSPNGQYIEKYLTLKINGEATKITTKSLPNATAGKSYKATLKATGADSFVWGAYGYLPEGLTCSPSGVISGTPLYSGEWSFYVYAISPNGQYTEEKYFALTVNDAAASTKKGSAPSTAPTTESTDGTQKQNQEQTDQSSITFGKKRSLSSLQADKNSPCSEALRKLSDGGYVIAAVLPEVQVTKDGMYDFSISLDESVPEGSKLLWRSLPLNGEDISDDDGGAVFRNSEGAEISEIPNGHEVSVSAWLRAGITYGPVVAAKTAGNSEVKVSETAEIEDAESESEKRSTSAGCNGGLAGVISLAFLLFVKERRTCDKLCK